jgi:hypothetical protein
MELKQIENFIFLRYNAFTNKQKKEMVGRTINGMKYKSVQKKEVKII